MNLFDVAPPVVDVDAEIAKMGARPDPPKPEQRGTPEATAEQMARVLTVLRATPGYPASRGRLSILTELSDRIVRAAIAQLVLEGHAIISDREHGGYRLTTNDAQIRREVARLRSHAGELHRRATALASRLSEGGPHEVGTRVEDGGGSAVGAGPLSKCGGKE